MDLHVGIDIQSHQISPKNHRICFGGGESFATIKMDNLRDCHNSRDKTCRGELHYFNGDKHCTNQ